MSLSEYQLWFAKGHSYIQSSPFETTVEMRRAAVLAELMMDGQIDKKLRFTAADAVSK